MLDDVLQNLESSLRNAQINSDLSALSLLLSEHLIYIHSNGYVDNYHSYLEKINLGILNYQRIEIQNEQVLIEKELIIKHSIMMGDVIVMGVNKSIHSRTTTIWLLEKGFWKLRSFQSTSIDPAITTATK
jgi:hypothetical protein